MRSSIIPLPDTKAVHVSLMAVLILAAVASAARAGPPSIVAGKDLATNGTAKGIRACGACHGADGEGQGAAGIPRLAGLDAAYLRAQLVAFGKGTRDDATMTPIATAMDVASMADAAAYYTSLAAPPAARAAAPTSDIETGETIALRGAWAENIPPCASCHGLKGAGVGAAFPPIAGQSAAYIAHQLRAWQAGTRHDDPLGLMRTIAARLDERQIAAVSDYYAALPAATRTPSTGKGTTP